MWPVKPQMDMQSEKTAMKSIGLNKNCKATVKYKKQCAYTDSKSQSSKNPDKSCQETKIPKEA